jgi:hypothetical protein
MALRLRRGTDAERLLITPLEGELIYTTDTKKLYVGDGITLGGVAVDTGAGGLADLSQSSINDLADVNADSTIPSNGDVLAYDASSGDWRAVAPTGSGGGATELSQLSDVDNTVTVAGFGDVLIYDSVQQTWTASDLSGLEYNISIRGNDSTILVDAINDVLRGNLIGDVTGTLRGAVDGDLTGSVFADDSTLIIDGINKFSFANNRGNTLAADGTIVVDANAKIVTANVIGNLTGNVSGDITGDVKAPDGSVVVNNGTDGTDATFVGTLTGTVNGNTNGTHFGNVVGNVTGDLVGNTTGLHVGDVTGSVFGQDSTAVIDGITGFVVGEVRNERTQSNFVQSRDLRIGSATQGDNVISTIDASTTTLQLTTSNASGTIVAGRPLRVGGLSTGYPDSGIDIYHDGTAVGAVNLFNSTSNQAGAGFVTLRTRGTKASVAATSSGDSLGFFSALGFNGSDYRRAGNITINQNGSVQSTYIPAQIELQLAESSGSNVTKFTVKNTGEAVFTGPATLATYATTGARDTAIPSPTAGMMVFISGTSKAQVNTDGTTGGWVDLH